jgi:excinuclease ABC subunit C
MMEELLTRRLKMVNRDPEPDLIVIDGGKGQLGMACGVLEKLDLTHIPIIGLAKEFEEIFIPNSSRPIIIPKNNKALHLLQQVRDESHRFAITFHRQLRANAFTKSILDEIPGVGKKRKQALLTYFDNLDNIYEADLDDIKNVPSIPEKLAVTIYEVLQDDKQKKNN